MKYALVQLNDDGSVAQTLITGSDVQVIKTEWPENDYASHKIYLRGDRLQQERPFDSEEWVGGGDDPFARY